MAYGISGQLSVEWRAAAVDEAGETVPIILKSQGRGGKTEVRDADAIEGRTTGLLPVAG